MIISRKCGFQDREIKLGGPTFVKSHLNIKIILNAKRYQLEDFLQINNLSYSREPEPRLVYAFSRRSKKDSRRLAPDHNDNTIIILPL